MFPHSVVRVTNSDIKPSQRINNNWAKASRVISFCIPFLDAYLVL